MSTYETLSIVSMVLTSLIAAASIIVPFITSFSANKMKLKEREIELFYEHYNKAIDEVMEAYGKWKESKYHNGQLLAALYKTMSFCNPETQEHLKNLAENIIDLRNDSETDKLFYLCIKSLQKEFELIKLPHKRHRLLK